MNILLFPAGSQVTQELYDALKYEKNIHIYTTGADEHSYASFYFEHYIEGCPMISEATKTLNFLTDLIHKYNIKYLYPTFDGVFPFLRKHQANIPCEIILPSEETVNICNSKRETYRVLSEYILTPKQYTKENYRLPVYVKPAIGYGTRNHKLIKDGGDLECIDVSENLLLEYLPGREFTVDCFTNSQSKLVYCHARERLKAINGLAVISETIYLPEIETIGASISSVLKMRGAWFFQVKYNSENKLCLLEVACRVPGSMCTNRMRGLNFPLLTLLDREYTNVDNFILRDIRVKSFKVYKTYYKSNLPTFSTVYCDLDDTLILNNKVNIDLIRLLYKFQNENKHLVLLTRNANARQVLDEKKIAIFNEIVIVPSRELKKSDYIKKNNSIFIDDSYMERVDVSSKIGCSVFSLSDLELFN